MNPRAQGEVVFVGAGPGASDLITLRGARVIAEADIVIWASSLVDEGIVAGDLYKAMLAKGLVTNAVTPTAIRFAPPLTVSDEHVDEAVGIMAAALAEVRP